MGHSDRVSVDLLALGQLVRFSAATSDVRDRHGDWRLLAPPNAGPKKQRNFSACEKIESIGLLHPRHSLAITAHPGGRTWLTFTYDPGLLSPEDIQRLVEMYQEQLVEARRRIPVRGLINDCLAG